MDKAPPQLVASAAAGLPVQDAILRCQAAVLARPRLEEAATALAAELVELLHCRRVSVGLLDGERMRIVGSSQAGEIDPRHAAAAALGAAMHEALDQRLSVAWPPLLPNPPVSLAQRQLAGSGRPAACPSCPVPSSWAR